MIYIGIDPGVSGGIASLDDTGNVIEVHRMPDTPDDLVNLLRVVSADYDDAVPLLTRRAMLEQVNAGVFNKPGQRMGVSSAFTFGRGFGRLETALAALRIPFDLVQAARWQTALGCRTHGDKNISKARAQQLWPGRKITHAIADALLLAEYGRRLHRGHLAATHNGGTDGKEGEKWKAEGWQAGKKTERSRAEDVGPAARRGRSI